MIMSVNTSPLISDERTNDDNTSNVLSETVTTQQTTSTIDAAISTVITENTPLQQGTTMRINRRSRTAEIAAFSSEEIILFAITLFEWQSVYLKLPDFDMVLMAALRAQLRLTTSPSKIYPRTYRNKYKRLLRLASQTNDNNLHTIRHRVHRYRKEIAKILSLQQKQYMDYENGVKDAMTPTEIFRLPEKLIPHLFTYIPDKHRPRKFRTILDGGEIAFARRIDNDNDFMQLDAYDMALYIPDKHRPRTILHGDENTFARRIDNDNHCMQLDADDLALYTEVNESNESEDGDKANSNVEGKFNKCVFCSQHLIAKDIPKLLECLHVTCNVCITAKLTEIENIQPGGGAVVRCPKCSTSSQPDGLILNQFLIETSETNIDDSQVATEADPKALKCSSCTEDEPATSWCVECAEYICDSCVQAHQRLKITKEHTIKPKDEANENDSMATDDKTLMCHVHLQEKLSLFCETCDKLTCRDCQLVDHRDHKYKFANEIATDTRNSLAGLLNEISYKRVLLNSAMNVIDERQKLIADKKKELVAEITNMVVHLTNTINARGKKLVHQLSEVCDGKLKVLNEKKDALQSLSSHTDHCIDFVQFALDNGSDSAVLFSKKTLTSHLQKVKCQRADIPNPEIPVRIHVQVSNVPDLQKVISQLGGVIVDGKPYPPTVSPSPMQTAVRQQTSPNMNQGMMTQHVPVPNMMSPVSLQQQPMPAHRSGMPPPSISPQIPVNMNMRNSHAGTTSPLQQNLIYSQQHQVQPNMINQQQKHHQMPGLQAPPLIRSYSQDNSLNNVPGYGRFPNMGPRQNQFRQIAPHVSSSTHPQMGGANQTAQIPCGTGNEFNPIYSMNQGLPAQGMQTQGMQMGHIPPPLNQQQTQQNQMMMQQRQRQHQSQTQQQTPHVQQQSHAQQQQTQPAQNPQPQQQTQQHHMQDTVRLQMQKQMMQSRGHPPNYPMAQSQSIKNAMNQRGMMPHQNVPDFQKQMSYPPNPVANQPPAMNQSAGSWHTPQSARQTNGSMMNQQSQSPLAMQFCSNGRLNENSFKISLPSKQPNPTQPATPVPVTSTNPKTPSPNTNDNAKDPGETIDKACAESVNNFTESLTLMETIAKLDSNGVQVLPEGQRGKTTSPQVSSTDYCLVTDADKQNKDDPNEDWCAVCQDGGELMCCDKCPKVFHQHCHVPIINPFPDENEPWQCMLCFNFNDMPLEPVIGDKRSSGLSPVELKRCQRILLELYCQNERSVHFRELEPKTNTAYYEIIKDPISLDVIRDRMEQKHSDRYRDVQTFINDIRLLFGNALVFYQENTKVFKSAKYLEKFFNEQLAKLLPDYLPKKPNDTGRDKGTEPKRIRIDNEIPTEIIDDDD